MNTHRALSAIFAEKFGLQPREASVLGALYLNRERPTGPVSLAEQAGASPTAIHHHLSCLRNDLAPSSAYTWAILGPRKFCTPSTGGLPRATTPRQAAQIPADAVPWKAASNQG